VPTWLVLKHQADWRWADHGERTPWYPAMRLFRQPRPGDWDGVMQHIAAGLARCARAEGPAVPAHEQALSDG